LILNVQLPTQATPFTKRVVYVGHSTARVTSLNQIATGFIGAFLAVRMPGIARI